MLASQRDPQHFPEGRSFERRDVLADVSYGHWGVAARLVALMSPSPEPVTKCGRWVARR